MHPEHDSAPSILVVDDNPLALTVSVKVLRQAGYTVLEAASGMEALRRVHEAPPSLVLLDVVLPDLDGLQVLRRIRTNRSLDRVAIILITSRKVEPADRVAGLDAGADAYLTRPLSNAEFIAQVQACLRRQSLSDYVRMASSLADERRRLRDLADAMPMMVWTANAEGAVDYSNQAFFDYTGQPVDSDPATRWQPCVHPDDLERCMQVWLRCVQEGSFYEVEMRLRRGVDGLYRWFRVQARPSVDSSGKVQAWFGAGIDIDDTKRMEKEAVRMAERLTSTLECLTDGFFTLDRDLRLTYLNGAAERILGLSRSQCLGQPARAFCRFCGHDHILEHYEKALQSQSMVAFEDRHGASGAWLEVRVFPFPEGLAVYLRDVSLQREEETRFRRLLQDIPMVAVQGYDLDGTIRYWNKASEKFYGYSEEEALGRNLIDLIVPPDLRPALEEGLRMAATEGRTVPHGEFSLRRKDGTRISVFSSSALVSRPDGPPQLFSLDIDLTERNKLEQQFLRAQRLESIGTLSAGIAHDLNNLLTPIVMGIDFIKRLDTKGTFREIIESMERSAGRGADLVRQVLSFARGAEGARVALSPTHVVHELAFMVRNSFPKSIRFQSHLEDNLWNIVGDPTQINQVLLNLCVNARDAMPNGGEIILSVANAEVDAMRANIHRDAKPGKYVIFSLSDTGVGMPPEVLDRVFEPFFTTKAPGEGTGLGLPSAMSIVHGHGGFMNAYSEVGRGTVFKVYLPVPLDSGLGPEAIEQTFRLPRGNGETILVVDDEVSVLQITSQTLEAYGYRVLTAQDGAQAVVVFAAHRNEISLVLTDIMMPVMDGVALIHALKHLDPSLRIVAASGLNANGSVARASGAGVRDFLPKPYSTEGLLRIVRKAIEAAPDPTPKTS